MNSFDSKEFIKSGAVFQFSEDNFFIAWGCRSIGRKQFDQAKEPILYTPEFFSYSKLQTEASLPEFWSFANFKFLNRVELLSLVELDNDDRNQIKCKTDFKEKEKFKEDFFRIQDEISDGFIGKALPITFAEIPGFEIKKNIFRIIKNVLTSERNIYLYGQWSDQWRKQDGVIGATPEILFSIDEDKTLRTMALAGTRELESDKLPLLEDQKELNEHQFVVDEIIKELGKIGKIEKSELKCLRLSTLEHLKTDILVKLESEVDLLSLVSKLHPTPALGVSPKTKSSLKFLESLSHAKYRKRFGAPFLLKTKDRILCLVGIRNIQWSENKVELGAGCGIVAESDMEKEWSELNLKKELVLKTLGLS